MEDIIYKKIDGYFSIFERIMGSIFERKPFGRMVGKGGKGMIKKPPRETPSSSLDEETGIKKTRCIICLDNSAIMKTTNCCQQQIFCQPCYGKYILKNSDCPNCRRKMGICSLMTDENPGIDRHECKRLTFRYGGCCLLLVLILGILGMNYYFIHDANLKQLEAKKELKEKIISSQCNATIVGTCPIRYNKYGSIYKICYSNSCIQQCLDINQPTDPLDCFFIKGDIGGTLTIEKRTICCSYGSCMNRNKNKYCQNEDNTQTRFILMIIFIGVIGTGMILACGCGGLYGLWYLTQQDWE